jgi:hypothetical protein
MNPIDIRDLALNLSDTIAGLDSHRTRGPLLVTRDGQPEAVIIRHQAYAPRLHDFSVGQGGIRCHHCSPSEHIICDTSSLSIAVEAANRHWREQHQTRRALATDPTKES